MAVAKARVWATRAVWATEFEATRFLVRNVRDTHRVPKRLRRRVRQVYRCFVARHQATVAVLGWPGEGLESHGRASGYHRWRTEWPLAQVAVLVTRERCFRLRSRSKRGSACPSRCRPKIGLGMKVADLPCSKAGVFRGVLQLVHVVRSAQHRCRTSCRFRHSSTSSMQLRGGDFPDSMPMSQPCARRFRSAGP